MSDSQLGAGRKLAVDRLADQEAVLDKIADLADAENVDLVLHCGDVFDSRYPSDDARMVFKRFAKRASVNGGRRFFVVAGNHDLRNAALPSSVDLYDHCRFVRRPEVIPLGGLTIACLPWAPPGNYVAKKGGGDRDELNAQIGERLVEVAQGLREECGDGPAILALHWWIEGATTATGYGGNDVIREPVIPLADLEELGFDAVIAGHVHLPQVLNAQVVMRETQLEAIGYGGIIFYCGPPSLTNFGEESAPHGVYIVDTEARNTRFVDIPDRRFVTVKVDLTTERHAELGLDETDAIAAELVASQPLEDASVRIRYTGTREQARTIDVAAIRTLCDDAGVHKLCEVTWIPSVRDDRARAEGLDDNLSEMQALDLYIEANPEIVGKHGDALRERLARRLQEVLA